MEDVAFILARANEVYARAASEPPKKRPPVYKAIGISLAIASGVFIGTSFVLKKTGLLRANVKYNEEAGEGYGYLKNVFWWSGMTLMIIGEVCNFVAYAFVDAILVTPLGALSVVITTILSAIFLKERLSFIGKVGCFNCIIGSIVIVLNAPPQASAGTIQEMQHFVLSPGFLSYAGVIIVGCAFIALWAGPRYGKKSMLVYLSICSLIGGLSVVATQGLGAAIVTQAGGTAQFNHWFLYVLLVFVIATLVTEIIYLNKALNLFNAALVTPTYYVFFTSSTIVASAVLFQGFHGSVMSIITVILGFLQICAGVVLLQLSKSAKDVPDAAVLKGDLDQMRTVAEQEEPESEPKADAIRGTAAIIRRFSQARQKNEMAEAKRVHEDRMKDQMDPIGEDEQVQWDGLRRRKTSISGSGSLQRRKTLHPPLGMSNFPNEEAVDVVDDDERPMSGHSSGTGGFNGRFMNSFKRNASSKFTRQNKSLSAGTPGLTTAPKDGGRTPSTAQHALGAVEMDHVYGLPPSLHGRHAGGDGSSDPTGHFDASTTTEYTGAGSKPITWADSLESRPSSARPSLAPTPPPHSAKRQFSFQNPFHRSNNKPEPNPSDNSSSHRPSSRLGIGSRGSSKEYGAGIKDVTEEERIGLVVGDSKTSLAVPDYNDDPEYSSTSDDGGDWHLEPRPAASVPPIREESETGSGRSTPALPPPRLVSEDPLRRKNDWQGHPGGGGGGGGGGSSRSGGPAFI